MSELPKWASVALLTRCAKLLEPYLVQTWRHPPENAFDLIAETLRICTDAASTAKSPASMHELELSAIINHFEALANSGAEVSSGAKLNLGEFKKHIPEDEMDTKIVHSILEVVVNCPRTVRANSAEASYKHAVEGLTWTFSAIGSLNLPDLGAQINRERSLLESLCEEIPNDQLTKVEWVKGSWHITLPKPWWKFWE